ncbi:MAG: S8 family serine peptidase, partial [Acidimicrobiales bacterium]|nr:S8 family serine peptidase [Acidimicrobiales bacterium]
MATATMATNSADSRHAAWLALAVRRAVAGAVLLTASAFPAIAGAEAASDAAAGGAAAAAGGTAVSRELQDAARTQGSVDVIVKLRPAVSSTPTQADTSADRLVAAVEPSAGRPVAVLDTLGVVALGATGEDLQQLAASPLVERIEADLLLAPALDRSTAQVGAPAAWAAGQTGSDRVIAVIDSGVDAGHPALAGKVLAEACFSNNGCPNGQSSMTGAGAARPCSWGDGCEHGTHVSGVAAANGERRGVAPGASLLAIQVFSPASGASCGGASSCPRARTSDVLAALNHVNQLAVDNTLGRPIVAVNLSLASDVTSPGCDDSILAGAVSTLWKNNVATVVAAGNSGRQGELSVPACISATVSVGAVDGGDAYWPVSNASSALDFFAPGVGVTSSWPGGTWRAASGTSTAAPHVAGGWAVAAQALNTTNPKTIYDWLRGQQPTINVAGTAVPRLNLAGLAGLRSAQFSNPQDLASVVGDFDGNRYDDIYWFDRTGASSQIWWFGPSGREQVTASAMSGTWRPVGGDFNGDGYGDIYWYDPNGPTYFWFGRSARGGFEGTGPFYPWGDFTPFGGDFNGDGYDDVYLYDRNGGQSYIFWMGQTPGWPTFATVTYVGIPASPGAGFSPAAGDFDGDGDGDIWWAHPSAAYLEWSNRNGSFTRRWAVPGPYRVVSADLDGGGAADVFLYAPHNTWLWSGGINPANSYPA